MIDIYTHKRWCNHCKTAADFATHHETCEFAALQKEVKKLRSENFRIRDDLLWKCQGILSPTDYMRLAGLVVAEKELRHSKKMLEEQLEIQKHSIVRECAEVARQHNLQLAERSYMIHKHIQEHFGVE